MAGNCAHVNDFSHDIYIVGTMNTVPPCLRGSDIALVADAACELRVGVTRAG